MDITVFEQKFYINNKYYTGKIIKDSLTGDYFINVYEDDVESVKVKTYDGSVVDKYEMIAAIEDCISEEKSTTTTYG